MAQSGNHLDAEPEHQGDNAALLPHLESFEKMMKLPVVEAAWHQGQDVYGKVKAKAPIIKEPPQEIYNQAKTGVDTTSALAERLLDYYFPKSESDVEDDNTPIEADADPVLHTCQTVGRLSNKVARRVYRTVSRQVKLLKKEDVHEYVASLIAVLRLTQYLNFINERYSNVISLFCFQIHLRMVQRLENITELKLKTEKNIFFFACLQRMKQSVDPFPFYFDLNCNADPNFVSFITKFYDSKIKSFHKFFHLNNRYSDSSELANENEIDQNDLKDDENVILNYFGKDSFQVYQYEDYNTNFILSNDDDFPPTFLSHKSDKIQLHQRRSRNEGFINKILKLFGYLIPEQPIENRLSTIKISNQTNGLDVHLKTTYFTKMLLETMESKFKLIYPGTLWCGGGSVARRNNDYGLFWRTDKCCRKHDSCPKYILAGQTWKNLENIGIFTRSHCECDRAFYTCLKRSNSFISNKIGVTYFNLLRPQCFRKEYPVVSCLERRKDNRCFNYVIDDEKPKQWQWFDNKVY
ncbi:Lipid storage droplets surface-binding protein 2 [Pseudolycoriella hygida]|uniref:Phospholipase A2 n=1 Tax=Pseudolycoriella hygida TaxID=35572 RepID=A0A9Q0MUQ5_9DIPT|nr:Lipid storage droplets surface-binding protein 2 [Pseudolycoriella hygida]